MRTRRPVTKLELDKLAKTIGRHRVDENLYLAVRAAPQRLGSNAPPVAGPESWVFRYMRHGKAKEAGLGPYPLVGLADARTRAEDARRLLVNGQDPLVVKAAKLAEQKREAARALTFKQVATAYIAHHSAGWKNPKSESQWSGSLSSYVYPLIGERAVGSVDTAAVLEVLLQPVGKDDQAFWTTLTETASRIRGRIELVLDYATTHGYREQGANPARWKGHLSNTLPAKTKVHTVQHHAAISLDDLPRFLSDLHARSGHAARAMELVIYTAARTAEALKATWAEFDLDKAVWTLPPARMKAGREHVVPLSSQSIAMLRELKLSVAENKSDFVFPGPGGVKPISHVSLQHLIGRMKREGVTAHGMRAAFRTWAALNGLARDLAELSLAHAQPGLEAAYQRDKLVELRRDALQRWCDFCEGRSSTRGQGVADDDT